MGAKSAPVGIAAMVACRFAISVAKALAVAVGVSVGVCVGDGVTMGVLVAVDAAGGVGVRVGTLSVPSFSPAATMGRYTVPWAWAAM
jgi:hypothetical protein